MAEEIRNPFGVPACPACLHLPRTTRYCNDRCVRVEPGKYEYVARIGDAPWPHLHRTCDACGFQWLERTFFDTGRHEVTPS